MSASGEGAHAPGLNPVLRVLLPFAIGYFLSYFFRSINAVIGPALVRDFAVSPADLGLLTSAYFLTFAAFQLPLGLLLDRFGPRRTDAALLLIAALGALLFAFASSLSPLIVGRAVIGLGVCGCLMSGIKANVMWFPASRLAAMNGWMFFAGGVGMIAATVPLEAMLEVVDWRALFVMLAVLTVLASALIFIVVPERAATGAAAPLAAQLRGLAQVFAAPSFWRIGIAAVVTQSISMAVQGLWAGPWLRDVAGLTPEGVALHLLGMGCGTIAGFLFWGNFAVRMSRRGASVFAVYVAGMGMFLLVQLLLAAGLAAPAMALWAAFGFFGTAGSLSYAILSQQFPSALAGRVNTALNSMVFAWAFLVQWGMGAIIGLWPVSAAGYDRSGYCAGFGAFLAVELMAWIWMLSQARHVRAGARHKV